MITGDRLKQFSVFVLKTFPLHKDRDRRTRPVSGKEKTDAPAHWREWKTY
jgi:hypothetical protein